MCRAKSDPNYFRCDWGAGRLARALVGEAAQVSASTAWIGLDTTTLEALEALRTAAIDELAGAIAGLSGQEQVELLAHSSRRRHLLCSIAAMIGDFCASLASVNEDIAIQIGLAVRDKFGSKVLGKLASITISKWLNHVAPGPAQVTQIGLIADMVAVSACPAQTTKSPGDHHEVVKCAQRLEDECTQALVTEMLAS